MPVIDFSNVKGLEPVEEGTYSLRIEKATSGTSASGQPKIDLQWTIEEGELAGRKIFDTLSFHPDALWRTKLVLEALGFDVDGEIDSDELPEQLLGQSAVCEVEIQESDPSQINPKTNEPYSPRNRIAKIVS